MKLRTFRRILASGAFAAALPVAALGVPRAEAAVIGAAPNADFSVNPVTIEFGNPGQASYTFGTTNGDPDSVMTGGTAQVASLGAPFYDPPRPTAYFSGAPIDQNLLAQFLSYSTPAPIPFSIADDFVGLKFTLDDGVHFGYAEVAGPTLIRYGYESAPGVGILTGAPPSPVPVPGSLGLLTLALSGLLGATRLRGSRS